MHTLIKIEVNRGANKTNSTIKRFTFHNLIVSLLLFVSTIFTEYVHLCFYSILLISIQLHPVMLHTSLKILAFSLFGSVCRDIKYSVRRNCLHCTRGIVTLNCDVEIKNPSKPCFLFLEQLDEITHEDNYFQVSEANTVPYEWRGGKKKVRVWILICKWRFWLVALSSLTCHLLVIPFHITSGSALMFLWGSHMF